MNSTTCEDKNEAKNEHNETEIRLLKLKSLKKDPYQITKFYRDNNNTSIIENFEQFNEKYVNIAGRLISKRGMGKVLFYDLMDEFCKIQLYISQDKFDEDQFENIKKLDVGDIIGVYGQVFRTKRGEISIRVEKLSLLSKSLRPLPEKHHGLQSTDLRYRKRYLDLISNPGIKKVFRMRSKIIAVIREFLDNRNYLEVDTPILNTIPGGAAARPFVTHHNTLDIDMYLRIAPELYLKRLIVGGFEKVYEIGRIFRNEGMSQKHNPEFTSIELYEVYQDYNYMMDFIEELVKFVVQSTHNKLDIEYDNRTIEFGRESTESTESTCWERISMLDAVKKYANIDFGSISNNEEAIKIAERHGVHTDKDDNWGKLLNKAFEMFVEPKLWNPTFIIDYPVEISPLAKRKIDNFKLTERFELFITNKEIANGFSELNDPIDQKLRFIEQVKAREAGDPEANMMDDDFVEALEYGMPPTVGMGMGIDRLVMLLTNSQTIRDVLLFPTMKPLH